MTDPAACRTACTIVKSGRCARDVPFRSIVLWLFVITSSGTLVFDLFGTNKIGTIDPETLEITEYTLPEGARPRRIAVDGNDIVWYTDYQRSFLGRLDLDTKQVRSFRLPAGPSRSRTPSASRAMARSGTASPAYSRTRSSGSIQLGASSSSGTSLQEEASCATWSRLRTATCSSRAAGWTRSRGCKSARPPDGLRAAQDRQIRSEAWRCSSPPRLREHQRASTWPAPKRAAG